MEYSFITVKLIKMHYRVEHRIWLENKSSFQKSLCLKEAALDHSMHAKI